ncbi:hypothetical protein AVEN_223711-1 [Araneus ventricosus]|uniref:Uncharacterized protein n=1 Tax=Araneus ventricosus TaxID=182803 RepID=A0A4Y2QRA6_ARAVE|nr:hypothetical protein AVEN_223711-1 [Araneus ventricosus]
MTVTALSIALSPPAFQQCRRNSKVVLVDQQHYRDLSAVFYTLPNRSWLHIEFSGKTWIPATNRKIEKVIAFSGIFDLSSSRQNGRQGQGPRARLCPSLHTYPCKTPFPTIRPARQESDITSL